MVAYSTHEIPNNKEGLKQSSGFVENKGQIIDQNNKPNPAVLYLLNTPGMNVQLRKTGFSYDVYSVEYKPNSHHVPSNNQNLRNPNPKNDSLVPEYHFHRIDIDLQNSNPNPAIETYVPSKDYLNYYTTGTPEKGVTLVKSFGGITYKNVYPGIDLQFICKDGIFEYNFLIQPGADIASIQLKVAGPERIKYFKEKIQMVTTVGDIDETIPLCYYSLNNNQVPVKGRFKKIKDHIYGFSVDQTIPDGAVLLIDPIPTRRWGTYYGLSVGSNGGCAGDNTGNVYISGATTDPINIATTGAFQTAISLLQDAFLAKFSPDGERLWGTYFGGTAVDQGISCATDHSDSVYLVGFTTSPGLATPGAYQTSINGIEDGFIAKFNSGGQLLWSTYYGGHELLSSNGEFVTYCVADSVNNIYCSGKTSSPDAIATSGASQSSLGGNNDGFLVKFTSTGQRIWGTYYGGANNENDIFCSVSNSFLFLSGSTNSANNIATPGSFMPTFSGLQKAFLACFDLDGSRQWGTYFGGTSGSGDISYGCCSDLTNNVYLYGITTSSNNIGTTGTYQSSSLNGGGYLEKFNSAGDRLWGTYYGHSGVQGAVVDDSGYVYICGKSAYNYQDPYIASPNAYQTVEGGNADAILAKITGDGQRIWGTYYGGSGQDQGNFCIADHYDNIYLYGCTTTPNNSSNEGPCTRNSKTNIIASQNGLYPNYFPTQSVFLVKLSDCYSPDTALQIFGPLNLCQNSTGIIFSIDHLLSATDYHWCVSGNLTITSGQGTTSITVDVGPTLGLDSISVYGINACDAGFPKGIVRLVVARPVPVLSGPDTTCAGITNVYTTTGGKTNYQWTVSPGGTITLNGTATDSSCTVKWSVAGAHWVKIGYTETTGCASLNPTLFNVWVNPGLITSVSISSSANPVCSGTSVTFMANPVNEGSTPFYQWKVNGIDAGINNVSYTYIPVNGDMVLCQLTSSLTGCLSGNPATSNQILMTVNVNQPVSITISPGANPLCSGTSVTFTAHPINEGIIPSYQWKVNGNPVGANLSTYTYIPLNGDGVTCTVNSNATCAVNNPAISPVVTMTVNPNLLVSVSIISSSNPFCAGSSVTFTATPNNGGTPPSYQWKVNGIGVGTNNQGYSYFPNNGDVVTCVLNSNIACPIGNPATSNSITMVVNATMPAGINIVASANPFCPGSAVTFTATAINGGAMPSYQWKVNGINAGSNSSGFSYVPVSNDSVRCVITSNLSCVTGNPAISAKIIMIGSLAPNVAFSACFDTVTTVNAKPFKLKGGLPIGGNYSGPGVNSSNGVFTPSVAGMGVKIINYSYINVHDCGAGKSKSILVQPYPSFTCGSNLVDTRDNKVYPTVQIGAQCWMASNLNFGLAIANTIHQADNCFAEKYCYNGTLANCNQYGGLYQWDEMMKFDDTPAGQGLCPSGWHVPTETDWTTLMNYYLGNGRAGRPLQDTIINGFKALKSGVFYLNSSWSFLDFATILWSSTSSGQSKAISHGMNLYNFSVSMYPASRGNAFGVRCLRD